MNLQTVPLTVFNVVNLEKTSTCPKQNRKYFKLPMKTKYEIVERLKNGESQALLSKEYNITKSTIGRISKLRNEIEKFWMENELKENSVNRKVFQFKREDSVLNACLETWYRQQYHLGNFISGKMLQEKALDFKIKLGGINNFKASNGWLQKFKFRCGIKLQSPQDEKKSPINSERAFEFRKNFSQALKNDKYPLENIYNAEENIIWWKTFPRNTEYQKNAPKVTLLVCANASGTHKIPLMIIGRSKIPRSLKNAHNLPVTYKAQESSWLDATVFKRWLREIFVPSVKSRQQEDGKQGAVVLLLDSAASRYVLDTNISSRGILIKIVLLPMNLTSNVLPMNQGVIEKLKIVYRQNLLREVLQRGNKDDAKDVQELLKIWNLKDSCYILKSAWESISNVSLAQAWRAVYTEDMFSKRMEIETEPDKKPELLNLLKKIPGYEDCSEADASNWLAEDSTEEDEVLEDDKMVVSAKAEGNENLKKKEDDRFEIRAKENQVSTKDAIASLENVLKWILQQDDFKEDVSYIIKLREKMNERRK